MNDQSPLMGHNNPPAFDPEIHADLAAKADAFMKATQQWLDLEAIETETQAGMMADQITGLRGLWKKTEEARKAAKKPHDDAGAAVQEAFTPILTRLKRAADAMKAKLEGYARKQAEEAEAERKRQAAEAERKAKEAEDAARAAQESGNLDAQIAAEQAEAEAEAARKAAEKDVRTQVKSASGAGRTVALRDVREARITNIRLLFLHYHEHPEVRDLLQRLANADVRAKDVDHTKIPGIEVVTRKVAS